MISRRMKEEQVKVKDHNDILHDEEQGVVGAVMPRIIIRRGAAAVALLVVLLLLRFLGKMRSVLNLNMRWGSDSEAAEQHHAEEQVQEH